MKSLTRIILASWIVAGSLQLNADDAVTIAVRPRVTNIGGTAELKVLVSRNEANRKLLWEIDGPNFYRSSEVQLDGASAPRSYLFRVHNLPSGEFEVRATVKRNDESTAADRSDLRVIGPEW